MLTGMSDFRGRPIYLGDTIVYATRHGSDLHLVEARVVDFFTAPVGWSMDDRLVLLVEPRPDVNRTAKNVRLSKPYYIVKVEEFDAS